MFYSHMRNLLPPLLAIFLPLALAACSGTPERQKPLDLPAIEKALEVQEVWREWIGSPDAYVFQPAVVGAAIFAADASGTVVRLDAGRSTWRVDVGALVGGVAADATQVLVGTIKGQVVALSARDGKELWRSQLSAEVIAPAAFAEGLVVVRSGDNRLHALDRADGQRKWSYQRSIPALSIRSAAAPLVVGQHVFAGFPGGKIAALSLTAGTLVWEGAVALPKGTTELERIADVVAAPVVGAREICAVAFQGRLACFDLVNGNLLWARDVSSASGLALDNKAVYVSDENGLVHAFDRTSGASLWKQDKLINRRLTGPQLVQGYVAIGDSLGSLHFIDAADGAFKARIGPDVGAILAPLAQLDGMVVLQSRRGFLIAAKIR